MRPSRSAARARRVRARPRLRGLRRRCRVDVSGDGRAQLALRRGLRAARARAARPLSRRGCRTGRTALVAWFGAAAAGLAYVPLNTAYRGALLEHTLNLLRTRRARRPRRAARPARRARAAGTSSVSSSSATSVRSRRAPVGAVVERGQRSRGRFPARAARARSSRGTSDMLMFTGGTTGRSKAVRRPYALYLKMAEAAFDNVGVGAEDRFFVCAPMFHGGADVPIYAMLRAGGSVAIVPGFRTQTFWEDVRRLGCTVALDPLGDGALPLGHAGAARRSRQPAAPRDAGAPAADVPRVRGALRAPASTPSTA